MRMRGLVLALFISLVAVSCGNESTDENTGGNETSTTSEETTTTTTEESTTTTSNDESDAAGTNSCPDAATIPTSATDITEASADFDGDGDGSTDRLVTYNDGGQWWVYVEWDAGGSSRVIVDEAFMGASAVGGYDLDSDGNDEAFVSISGPASGVMVGIFYRDGCDILPVLDETAAAPFVFPVTATIGTFTGATCNSIGDISLFSGELMDEDLGEYEVAEMPYSFDSTAGTLTGGFGDAGTVNFDEVGNFATLDCGNLANAM